MGEWKRVFTDPRRIGAVVLILLLSAAFFLVGKMDFFGRGSITSLTDGEAYYSHLTERFRGKDLDEIGTILNDEAELLNSYHMQLMGVEDLMTFPPEEVAAWIAEDPLLSSVSDLDDELKLNIVRTLENRVAELTEELEYIQGYDAYIEGVQEQARLQSQTALFKDENTFVHRNLVKTAEEFATMRGIQVEFGANRGIQQWVEFELADYLYLLLIILFVFSFLQERKAGLWGIIRDTRGGRWRMGVHRAAILAVVSVGGVALIFGSNLLISLSLSGGWEDMGRSVQSLEIFRTLTYHITVGEWIAQYLLLKAASGFMVGLFLWCLLGSISSVQFSLSVLCVTLAAEYALFAFLPVQSILNPLKYFNIFSYIRTSKLYTEYLNIDLFGYPFGSRRLALIWLPIFAGCFLTWAILLQHFRRPEGNRSLLPFLANMWNKFLDFFRRHFTIGGWELYKTLFYQKVLIILLVILVASGSLNFIRYSRTLSNDSWYDAYMTDLQGPLDDEYTDAYLTLARSKAEENPELLSAIDRVEARVETLRDRAEQGGYQPWIVSSTDPYDSIMGDPSQDLQHLNAAFSMVFIALCCAAMWAYEQQSGVVYMLRSLKGGRGGVLRRKLLCALVMTALVWAAVYVREFQAFAKFFHPTDIASPLGNFDKFQRAPFPGMTMGQLMAVVYTARFVMLFLVAMMVMFISEHSPTVEASYILNLVILGLPAILYALGIEFLGYLSPVEAVSAAEGFWTLATSGQYKGLIPLAVWAVVGIAALILNCRKWVKTGSGVRA